LIERLNTKIDELCKIVKRMDEENKTFETEIKKRERYLQEKLQLEIDVKQANRSNHELQTKVDALEIQINSSQNSFPKK